MKVIRRIDELNTWIAKIKSSGNTIGFVPTMGALHDAHLSLIKKSVEDSDHTVCSIFVNPLQFNSNEDFIKYPIDLEADIAKLTSVKCDLVFIPDVKHFYSDKPVISFNFGNLETSLEGNFRPGHFNGVAIVVARLLHLMEANRAYFGLKDLQQLYIVKILARDLGFKTEIIACEIGREENGLAMSSRNRRLSAGGRKNAAQLYKSLSNIVKGIERGMTLESLKENEEIILKNHFKLEYLELVKLPDFELMNTPLKGHNHAICIAAEIEGVRLIDNIVFDF